MIEFRIERRTGVAAYMQIVQQTRQAVLLGHLRAGDQLPTAREVVAATGINPNTVLKAYRQLDAEGLVETRPGAGTFVTAQSPSPGGRTPIGADSPVARQLAAWLITARADGITRAEIDALFTALADQTFAADLIKEES